VYISRGHPSARCIVGGFWLAHGSVNGASRMDRMEWIATS
jgi:hypothetical protein